MATVGYLLGAGASAQTIPVVGGIKEDIWNKTIVPLTGFGVNDFLQRNRTNQNIGEKMHHSHRELLADLAWLQRVCETHYSVDTYAKKLTVSGNHKELIKLKYVLSNYIAIKSIQNPIDNRYDLFFANLLNEQKKLPNHVKIFSWNYDQLMELSYTGFRPMDFDLARKSDQLNIVLKNVERTEPLGDGFTTVKLNGTINLLNPWSPYPIRDLILENPHVVSNDESGTDIAKQNALGNLILQYSELKKGSNPKGPNCDLSFAWETPVNSNFDFWQACYSVAAKVEVLVVIGYSFPSFNLDIDRKLLNEMSLDKIYIQSKQPDAIKARIEAMFMNHDNQPLIEIINDTDQFYIPYEYYEN